MPNTFKKSPWGKLDWFELQITPHVFRFAVLPNQPVLIGFGTVATQPTPSEPIVEQVKPATYLISPATNSVQVDLIVSLLDDLIEKHQVFQSPSHEPHKTFQDVYLHVPSLHLRIGYGTRRWQSWYAKGDGNLPENIREFMAACYGLGMLTAKSVQGKSISGDEALRQLHTEKDL